MKLYSDYVFILWMCCSLASGILFGPENSIFLSDPITETACGQVKGLRTDGVYSFRGIPYAEPPVGQLRWSPPRPLSKDRGTCWSGLLDGREFGSPCYQRSSSDQSGFSGNEDCLYLNIWPPTLNKMAQLPVMAWVHGGSFQNGNANELMYMPTERLSKETNFVYVGMNYRLQAFGFMALEILSRNSTTGTSGNYGIMDIIEALHWVQINIHNFGGDPNKVTIFGHSSGGTAIFALLASALSKGLFHKAWLSSASPVLNKTASDAFKDNLIFLNNTGCSVCTGYLRLRLPQLCHGMSTPIGQWGTRWTFRLRGTLMVHWPSLMDEHIITCIKTVDSIVYIYVINDETPSSVPKYEFHNNKCHVMKEAPLEAWINGHGTDVPVLIGCTAQEADLAPTINFTGLTWEDYKHLVRKSLGTFGNHIATMALKLYPPGHITPEYQYTTMISDARVGCATDYISFVAAEFFKSPVYRYVVKAWPSKPMKKPFQLYASLYSMHAIDVFGFFGSFGQMLEPLSLSDVEFQDNIRSEVMSFVLNGHPDTSNWLPFPSSVAEISQSTKVVAAYHPTECIFWLRNGFFSYSWIN